MQKTSSQTKERRALLRFEIICQIKTLRQEGNPLSECLRKVSSRPWPDSSGAYFSYRTVETWWYAYNKKGFGGLSGKPARRDAGRSRAIDQDTGLWIIENITKNPSTPLQVLYRHLQKSDRKLPSISAVRRYLKLKGYDAKSLRGGRLDGGGPTKAFEAPAPGDLWMVDFANGPTLSSGTNSKAVPTYLCVILDDHSRLIPYGAYCLKEDTASFLDCLKQAILRRGVPLKLYTDQGKPFVNHHVRIVCANLGIRLIHAKPYHAWSKGKVERLIQTIQNDFEANLRLEGNRAHNLSELNTAFSRWIAGTYHLRIHSSTGMTPHDRFNRSTTCIRPIENPDDIDPLFYTRTQRTVRKDGTVTLDKLLLEVPLSLRGLEVELRYNPILLDRIEVWHKDSLQGLARRANLAINSQTFNPSRNYAR
ncbi:MAG: DDE-type integrase/transposase/recombinase [Bdellovibrionaceae bacterium]|nr:DDE-type integrase/transposase/recombinase [Pseudobdellovibrionaceae bacterium]